MAVLALIELFGRQMLARTIGADGPLLVPVSLKVGLCLLVVCVNVLRVGRLKTPTTQTTQTP